MNIRTAFWTVFVLCLSAVGFGCGGLPDSAYYANGSSALGNHELLTVTVDYGQPIGQALAAGHYTSVEKIMENAEKPSSTLSGVWKVDYQILQFERSVSTADVQAAMRARGLEPATLYDLLAVGAAEPELQRTLAIVALGWVKRAEDGVDGVAMLAGNDKGRSVGIMWYHYQSWEPWWSFLAVKRTKIAK